MGCACQKKSNVKWLWTSPEGATILYDTEIQAKAKVIRNGGTYTKQG